MKRYFNGVTASGVVVLVVIVIAINVISSRLYIRFDMTDENIYSLSEGTERILSKLDGSVIAKFYFSRSVKSLPPQIKTYATRVEEVLGEYVSLSNQKVILEVFDPKPDTDDEEAAVGYGVKGISLPNGEQVYFGLVFLKGAKEVSIPYLDPRREEFLEYDLTESIVRLQSDRKAKIGVLSTLPVLNGASDPMNSHSNQEWVVFEQLKRNFEVEVVDPDIDKIADDIKVLFIFHPKGLGEKVVYAIDQFVMNGGRLIVAVDPFARIDYAYQSQMMGGAMGQQMPSASSDLPKLFAAWGITFTGDKLVGDRNRMVQVGGTGGMPVPYPYIFQLQEEDINSESVVTERLKTFMYAEGGSFSISGEKVELQSLIATTKDAGFINAQMVGMMMPEQTAKNFHPEAGKKTIVGIVSGEFESAFREGPPEGVKNLNHLAKAAFRNSIFLMGDIDFMYDANAVSKIQFGPQTIIRPKNDNLNLVLNAVEFMSGSEDLISIRSSGKISRPFTTVQEIQKQAQEKWQKKEEELSSRLQELQQKLNDLQQKRTDGGRFTLTPQQQDEIERFRAEEVEIRKSRRVVRRNLREDIERLGTQLVAINMLVVPFSIGMLGFFVFARRARRMKRGSRYE